jgi:hypothetical protein
LLSVTVGYVDFLAEDEHLPQIAHDHAARALDSALAAARVVSAFRQSLGCEPPPPAEPTQALLRPAAGHLGTPNTTAPGSPWYYDPDSQSIRAENGDLVASVRPVPDKLAEARNGRFIAEAPALWDVLSDAQQLAIVLLAGAPRGHAEEARIRAVLDRINAVTQRLES